MRGRRQPIGSLFVALLVWLTAVGSTRVVALHELRLLVGNGDGMPAMSMAAPRTTIVVSRETSRSPAISHDQSGFLPAPAFAIPEAPAEARDASAVHGRVRRAQGIASTYDATAPPR